MTAIADEDVIRCPVVLRNPFAIERLAPLSVVHRAAFRQRRRLSKRFVGKPAKRLFKLMLRLGVGGDSVFTLATGNGARRVAFNARNTQFGALYLPQNLPVYEAETSALLDLLATDAGVFHDIGANWGWYAVLVASRPGFAGSVHAFEPFPPNFQDLAAVVKQAGLDGAIHCHDVALADRSGETTMAPSDGVQTGLARLGEDGGVRVRLARLDDLGLPAPDVVKIDAEDHELAVLQGAMATIRSGRPFIVFENWLHRGNPPLTLDPFDLLKAEGYRFFYPGWATGEAITTAHQPPGKAVPVLAAVPFLPSQRFQLPDQLNVVAVPVERMDDFRRRLGGAGR
ncbi:MAG: FkbM family methyltransferase [Actinomycetota bacterium]